MSLFTRNLPKKPIITLPSGYSEEKAVDALYKSILFMVAEKQEQKKKLLASATTNTVLTFSNNISHAWVKSFKAKFPDDVELLGDQLWHKVEATFFEGVYICTLIFYNDKRIRGEEIQLPTGRQFEEYFLKEVKKFDQHTDYVDVLIPPYLFQVIKKVSLLILNALTDEKQFLKTSKEFQESILVQYMHFSTAVLAAYLIQDSFLKSKK